jgi:membrane-associated protease RseP (regulator of RpoE activity)
MGEVKIKSLEVGGQKATDAPAIVMDHPTVEVIARKLGPIHGIVGFPFFARFKMTVDYQAKTLTFEPSTYKPPDVMRALMTVLLSGGAGTKVLAPAGQWGIVPQAKPPGDDEAGVTVKKVVPGSAAAEAGLKPGDRILTLDGRWTDSVEDLYAAAGAVKAGTPAVVKVKRAGKEVELKVTPMTGL